jgi:hypothetical protein
MHYLFWQVVLSPYLFWLYSFWLSSCSLVLYLLTGSSAHSPMPFPLYWYPSYYILSPIPYYWSMMLSPITLTITSVCDSTIPLPLPYHQSLTHFSSLTISCTTTYSLVCACLPRLYKPYVLQLCSLTWIYLVLPGYLVNNLLSLTSLYLWSLALLWPLVIAS